jgi:hypothetical protein
VQQIEFKFEGGSTWPCKLPAHELAEKTTWRQFPLLATFAGAILVSAALLFMVQPMFTKMVLPRFGGAPSVWSVAIVFFQTTLLAGYAFAHLLTRYLPGWRSVFVQLAVMLAAVTLLPLAIAVGWERPPAVGEAFWLIGLFTVSIGLPFFALAANSPLLQAWFARTRHPAAGDPYFLYAASNMGSLLALVAYPVAFEPFMRLTDQAKLWSIGFYVLIVMIAVCGVLAWRFSNRVRGTATKDAVGLMPPTWREAARWIGLAAVPSGLLVAVTAHISTDVAAVPLLWVLPLALYLLTFVIVFSRRPIIPHRLVLAVQPLFLIALVATLLFNKTGVRFIDTLIISPLSTIIGVVVLHLAVFFVCALMCHGELARTRPAPKFLTSFYFWIAMGGAIGGVAVGLIAPHIFNWVAEYPILLALTLVCRPDRAMPPNSIGRGYLFVGLAILGSLLIITTMYQVRISEGYYIWIFGLLLATCTLFWRMPLPFAALVAFLLLASHNIIDRPRTIFLRSFFGVAKVTDSPDGHFRLLTHGTTLHGAQLIRDISGRPVVGPPEPLLYYSKEGAIAQTIKAVRAQMGGPIRYAVIGLGAGSLACYAQPDDTVHFYEIDATIIRIAQDARLFNFLQACRPNVPITLGDGRLTLSEAPDGAYDLIIVDAFSSDAIPIHLLTREAMAIYLEKLSAHGVVVLHVTNRHLELLSVVAGIASANGLITFVSDPETFTRKPILSPYPSVVAAVARSEIDFGPLPPLDWKLKASNPNRRAWTDDYSNIVGSLRMLSGATSSSWISLFHP